MQKARILAAYPQAGRPGQIVGQYAQARYLGKARGKTMTETVRAWREHGSAFLPTPHPSWRTSAWLGKNPWFEAEVLPALHRRVKALL